MLFSHWVMGTTFHSVDLQLFGFGIQSRKQDRTVTDKITQQMLVLTELGLISILNVKGQSV